MMIFHDYDFLYIFCLLFCSFFFLLFRHLRRALSIRRVPDSKRGARSDASAETRVRETRFRALAETMIPTMIPRRLSVSSSSPTRANLHSSLRSIAISRCMYAPAARHRMRAVVSEVSHRSPPLSPCHYPRSVLLLLVPS